MNSPEEIAALEKALDAAKDYADTVLKGPLAELGGILTDTIGYWRLKNRVRLMLRAKQWLEEKGVHPKGILPEVFVPLIEEGGNVEDETLSDMFASLLACHLDPEQQELVHPSYAKALAQLSPLDARVMALFSVFFSHQTVQEFEQRGATLAVDRVAHEIGVRLAVTFLSCLNLERLGIIEHVGYRLPATEDEGYPATHRYRPENQLYRFTVYGRAFCNACQYNERLNAPNQGESHNTVRRADV